MKFISKNPSVASVTPSGKVTGVAPGSTTIEVYTDTDEYRGQIPTTVVSNSNYVPTTGISLNKNSVTLKYATSSSVKLKATITPANATNKTITWTSSNNAALSCKDGYVKCLANGEGNFVVTARTADGQVATCNVTIIRNGTVVTAVDPTSIALPDYKSATVPVRLTTVDYDNYNTGYTVFANNVGISATDRTSTGFKLTIPQNYGSTRTFDVNIHGNFSGWEVDDPSTYHKITVTQPYYPDASGYGPHCQYQVIEDGVIKEYRVVETYFLARGGNSYRHVYDESGRGISGSASIEVRCAAEARESVFNRTTTSASWLHKVRPSTLGYWLISLEVDPNTTGVPRDAEVYIPGIASYKVHQDA